jgi:hypothetical protein
LGACADGTPHAFMAMKRRVHEQAREPGSHICRRWANENNPSACSFVKVACGA